MNFEIKSASTDDGARLAYKAARGNGPTLVFLPGWGSTKDYFDETLAHLPLDQLNIISMDPRGHGDSSEHPASYGSERQARDLLAVADSEGVERFVAIGHSMAAKFLQYLPIIAPEKLLGHVLIAGCPAGAVDAPDEAIAEWAGYAGDRDALRASHHGIITRPIKHDVSEKWIDQASKISKTVLHKTLEHCFRDDFSEKATGHSDHPPTLVIGALHDPFFPVEMMKSDVTGKIPGAREVYLDCGHEIPNETPQETARLIEAFVAGCSKN